MRRYTFDMIVLLRPGLILLASLLPLVGCGEAPARKPDARILMMGDSILAWNGGTGQAVKTDGQELDRRIAALAEITDGIFFLSLDGLVPHGNLTFHAIDRIHPSVKGSAAIGEKIAALIEQEES